MVVHQVSGDPSARAPRYLPPGRKEELFEVYAANSTDGHSCEDKPMLGA
jgi:hypothetical protein